MVYPMTVSYEYPSFVQPQQSHLQKIFSNFKIHKNSNYTHFIKPSYCTKHFPFHQHQIIGRQSCKGHQGNIINPQMLEIQEMR